jgi:type 2 lantibiotic biosynthesis protein LanM
MTAGKAFSRALTLPERYGRPTGAQPAPEAAGRLARWRQQPPFAEEKWWQARLSADGITEPGLLVLLSDGEAARLPTPLWAADFAAIMQEPGPGRDMSEDPGSALFAPAVASLLAAVHADLRDRLRGIDGAAFDPDELARLLCAPLPQIMHQMLLRTLVLELHRSRAAGELTGDSPAARFASFTAALRDDPDRRQSLFTAYPVLARQLAVRAQTWTGASARFAAHLAADLDDIEQMLAGDRRLGTPAEVLTGLGDQHRGASVTLVRWPDGTRVIYKPRPMAVDVHFQQLVGWVNDRGGPGLRGVNCLDRGDHGWMEFVVASPCPDQPSRQRFYRRQGALLALLYVLGASDFHAENLIAAGEDPVLIDLETLLQPGQPASTAGRTGADLAAGEAARGSVMAAGLLPQRSWIMPGGDAVDLSGLGYLPGQRSPLAVASVRDAGLDTMRVELAKVPLGDPEHRPAAADTPLRLLDYAPDLLAGFTEVYQMCAEGKAELAAGPLAAFAEDEVRVVLRPTLTYATILSISFHPDFLRDALDRERLFDALWRDIPVQPSLAACVAAERADLWHNDIPVFTTTVTGVTLHDSAGKAVPGYRLEPAMDRAQARLAALGPGDLARQRWLITATLATAVIEAIDGSAPPAAAVIAPARFRRPRAPVQPEPCRDQHRRDQHRRDQLLAAADLAGQRLAKIAFRAGDSAQWLGPNSPRGTTWSMGPLGAEFFHGLTGIALFLGWLGRLTGDERHTALARQALRTATSQLEQAGLERFGGMAGVGGLGYGLVQLARLWADESLVDLAEKQALASTAHAADDVLYDFVSGSAGSIVGLAALHELRPSAPLRECIRACASRLLATAIRTDTGIGWLSDPIRQSRGARLPIAGFAHGNAGIILALTLAAKILGDEACRDAAGEALAYEQALFDPARGVWAELGDPKLLRAAGKVPDRAYWCYGGTGIGLSRLRMRSDLDPGHTGSLEVEAALTLLDTQPVSSHCLCHGELGNIELYLQAAEALDRPELREQARTRGLDTAEAIRASGWRCGMPLNIQTPGLMFGLAGIGYGMLRLAEPASVPAVLTLQF